MPAGVPTFTERNQVLASFRGAASGPIQLRLPGRVRGQQSRQAPRPAKFVGCGVAYGLDPYNSKLEIGIVAVENKGRQQTWRLPVSE